MFIKDIITELALGVVLIPIFLFAYLYLVENGGPYFFIYVGLMIVAFNLILMWLYPNFIAPLFNKFEELEENDLRKSINELAGSINFPLKKIYKMDGSKRSAHSNAYFFGFGSNKRIVLFDTLIEQLNNEEITAVLAHELGHWKMKHLPKQLALEFVKKKKLFI